MPKPKIKKRQEGNGHFRPDDRAGTSVDRIAEPLAHLAVPIDRLVHDPDNARRHPERNLAAIRESLRIYGQLKPIVVRREGMRVVAGNGTLQAARELGWTKVAAAVLDLTEVEAAGFGLADNRTAELAEWDLEVVARLERMLREAGQGTVGWTAEEMERIRASCWIPPDEFPEVDERIEVEHECPRCGYRFSGGSKSVRSAKGSGDGEDDGDVAGDEE